MGRQSRARKPYCADNERRAIRDFMSQRNLSVNGWCKRAGMPESTLRSFLNGQSNSMTLQSLLALANVEKVSVQNMLDLPDPAIDLKAEPLSDGEAVMLILEKLNDINAQMELGLSEHDCTVHAVGILSLAKEKGWNNEKDVHQAISAWAIRKLA